MAKFYFFTNSVVLKDQEQAQSYGPVKNNETSQFRTTSLFSSPSVQKAYAVCGGKVFAQEVGGKINIILKPNDQPLGISVPVKYYVYKGLMKGSLVEADNETIESPTRSDLTLKIHKSQDSRNAAFDRLKGNGPGSTKTKAKISSIGLNLTKTAVAPNTLLDTAFIDDVFLRIDQDEFPSVRGGDDLGQFDYTNFGFEIILDGLGEGPRIESIRNLDNIIKINPNPAGDINKFKEDDKKDQILNYIDPCAFYSSFFFEGIKIKLDSSDDNFVDRKGSFLYDDILVKFFTRNVVYLDIRNEHNHALNYYRNYTGVNGYPEFYIAYDGGTASIDDYKTSGWPIYTIPTSSFTSANVNKPSTVIINLPKGNNQAPSIYRAQGYFFSGFRNMNQPPDIKEKIRNISFQPDDFTIPIAFSIPKLSNNITIPFYIGIRYIKRITGPISSTNLTLKAEHFIDNLFELTHLLNNNGLKIPLNNDNVTKWHVTGSNGFVDSSSSYGPSYIAKIGIGEDPSNIYFFGLVEEANIITDSNKKLNLLNTLSETFNYNIEFKKQIFVDTNNINQAILISNALPDAVHNLLSDPSPLNKDGRSLTVVAIDKEQLPLLQTAINLLEVDYDKRLVLRNKQTKTDISGNINYTEYDLHVVGYKFNSSVEVQSINTSIKILNGDNYPRIFASVEATQNFDGLDSVEENRKHFKYSRTFPDSIIGVRSSPERPEKVNNPHNIIVKTNGVTSFTILAKKIVTDPFNNQEYVWYNVEWENAINGIDPGPSDNSQLNSVTNKKVVSPGTGWIRQNVNDDDPFSVLFYPIATFEKFIIDFYELHKEYALDINASSDTIQQRLTRIRQRTKEDGDISDLFDKIIKLTDTQPDPPIRLNNILDSGVLDVLNYKIQLFKDYMGVRLGNGVVIDLHHLFIGLDSLNHIDFDKLITYFGFPFVLANTVDSATWAGDIGAGPADFVSNKDSSYEADWNSMHSSASDLERRATFIFHYYNSRAKDDDLYADVYSHLMNEQLVRYYVNDPTFNNIPAALYYFNQSLINEGDKAAFHKFFKYLNINPNFEFTLQPTVVGTIINRIEEFSELWWGQNNPITYASNLGVPGDVSNEMNSITVRYADAFLRWLERHK